MLLKDIEIELGAGSKAWYGVFASKGKTVELHSNQVEAFYGGQTKKAQADGRIIFQLKETGIAAFRVDSKVEESVVVPGVIYLLGSQETPYQIEVEDSYTFDEVVVEVNGKVYYSFVATKNGTVRIETETENAYITINGNPFKTYSFTIWKSNFRIFNIFSKNPNIFKIWWYTRTFQSF